MATFDEIRKHVLDDCREIIATMSLADPRISLQWQDIEPRRAAALRFLRQLLTRHVCLVLTRLHAKPRNGSTGVTASIRSLLKYAVAERRITQQDAIELDKKRAALIHNLETEGVKFGELMKFRHAEIAHSLHRTSKDSDSNIIYRPLHTCAHETFELMIEIEKSLVGDAYPKIPSRDLATDFHKWMDFGEAVWPDLVEDADRASKQPG